MQCQLIQPHLMEFYFGTLGMKERISIEMHLSTCTRCLEAFFSFKRHFEVDTEEDSKKPSLEMKTQLFNEVANLFPEKRFKPFRVLPIRSVLTGAAAVSLFLFFLNRPKHTVPLLPQDTEIKGSVDSARQGVENVNFL